MPRPSTKLTASRLMILADLGRCKKPTTVGSLALETGLSAAYISQCMEIFVRLGLAVRHDNPDDRRVSLLNLTEDGKRLSRSVNRGKNGLVRVSGLTPK